MIKINRLIWFFAYPCMENALLFVYYIAYLLIGGVNSNTISFFFYIIGDN